MQDFGILAEFQLTMAPKNFRLSTNKSSNHLSVVAVVAVGVVVVVVIELEVDDCHR